MSLRWDAVTVDATDPEALALFWSSLLGVGVRGRWEQYVGLEPHADGAPRLVFQGVPDRVAGRSRLHLDLHVADPAELDRTVARAVGLGATRTAVVDQAGQHWVVLADPEGNAFCLVRDSA